MIQRLFLTGKEIFSKRFISLIVFMSVWFSVFAVGIFGIIGDNFNNYVQRRFASSIPPNTIRISPRPSRSFLFFQADKKQNRPLGIRALKLIRRIGGVSAVYPVMSMTIPMQARISFLAFSYRADVPVLGAPYQLVRDDLRGRENRDLWVRPDAERSVPVIVPGPILQAYNEGMAGPNRLPLLTEKSATGMRFKLIFGQSSLRRIDGAAALNAVVAGFTSRIDSLALVIPLQLAREYNEKFDSSYRTQYQFAFVRVRDHQSMVRATSEIQRMGFVVEAEKAVSENILVLKRNVALIIGSLKYIIMLISIIAVSFATVIATMGRIEYYQVLRIIGGSKIFISFTILVKYLIIGYAGAMAGLKMVEYLSSQVAGALKISGVMISFEVSVKTGREIVLWGGLIPVVSTIPALIRLYARGLGRE